MSLMESIRRSTDSTVMRLIFGGIVLTFVFWGAGGAGGDGVTVAEVGGVMITDSEMNRAVRMAARGESLDDAAVKELTREVIEQLIVSQLLKQEAQRIGLEVSDEEVARAILREPAFQDKDGKFSETQLDAVLRSMNMLRGDFEERTRQDLLRQKLQTAVVTGVIVPDAEVDAMLREQLTAMSARWVLLSDAALLAKVPVDDAAVQKKLAEEEKLVREQYDRELATRWSAEEKVLVHKISLKRNLDPGTLDDATVKAKAEQIRAEAAAGADFAGLARTWSEDLSAVNGGRIGAMSKLQLGDGIAEAVFGVADNGISAVLETPNAYEIYRVESRTPAKVTTFDEAKLLIAKELVQKERLPTFADEASKGLLAAWTQQGAPPAAQLAELGVEAIQSPDFSPTQPRLPGAGSSPELNAALAKATAPGLLPQVFTATNGRVLIEVTKVEAPDAATLDMFRDMARGQLERERRTDVFERWLKDLRARSRVVQTYTP